MSEDADAACIHRRIASTCLDCLRDARDERDSAIASRDRAIADAGRLAAALEAWFEDWNAYTALVHDPTPVEEPEYRGPSVRLLEQMRAALEQHKEGGAT